MNQCVKSCSRRLAVFAVAFVSANFATPLSSVIRESRDRPDLLDANSPRGLRVVQITTDKSRPSHHVYSEAHVFTPDSRRFVFYRRSDLWLCDVSDHFSLRQLTDEIGVVGPSVSPDGRWMYYLAETARPLQALVLKRVSLATFERETFITIKDRVAGRERLPYGVYGLSSISSDGKRLCFGAFFSDGVTEGAPWGLLIFDLEKRSTWALPLTPEFINPHPQYSRSREPAHHRDILVQHNQGGGTDPQGVWRNRRGPGGCILHVVRDDGAHWRHVPLGLVVGEPLSGHEQWRGPFPTVVAAATWGPGLGGRLFEGVPIAADRRGPHRGLATPRSRHTDLSAGIAEPRFWHFSVDDAGMHVVSDWLELDAQGTKRVSLVVGSLSRDVNPSIKIRYLLNTRTSAKDQPAHPHPFFSPDAKMVFFNSDADGAPQIWMASGYTFPE